MSSTADKEDNGCTPAPWSQSGPGAGATAVEGVNHKLRDRLRLLQRLTNRIPDTVFQYQGRDDGGYWFAFISEAVRAMFRVAPEDAQRDAQRVFAAIHPDDRTEFFSTLQRALRAGASWTHEFRVKFDDGTQRWLLANAMTWMEGDGRLVSYGAFTDITDRKEIEARLQASEARFRSLTELSSDWYWETDAQYRFTRFDGYRQGGSNLPMEYTLGKTRWELGSLNLSEEDWQQHRLVLARRQMFKDFEIQRLASHGQTYWITVSGMPMFDAQGEFRGYRGIGREITTRKLAEDETLRLAFYDTLTGLPNRRLLMNRLSQALALSERSQKYGAILFIDLDNFKDLNDTQGHDVGDQLLQQVALRLANCVREVDSAARFGGDEFVVMIENLSEELDAATSQARQIAEKILGELAQPYSLKTLQHSSTPSIGITMFSGATPNGEEALKRADVAMYQAKADGRNTLRFFDPSMQSAVVERACLDADLRLALQRQELVLHCQPVVDGVGRATGFEALLRWQHPVRGLLPAGQFIGQAEQSGLIGLIGKWVLQTACQQLVAWAERPELREMNLSVNVSARQFKQSDFVTQALTILEQTGANPKRLKIELTENALLGDVEDAIRKMHELHARGVGFLIDNFGSGHSSLRHLRRMPLDQVKIDQSLVRDILTNPNDAAIVRTILALAQSLDLTAVAEGVETAEQRTFLLDHGCLAFQGYLFGAPEVIQ